MTIISNSKEFIFVHLHKCAGSSVEIALESTLEWNDILLGSTPYGEKIQVPYAQKFSLGKHSSAMDIKSVIGAENWESYYSFSFVRHPLDRLVSLYSFFNTYYLKGLRNFPTKLFFYLSHSGTIPKKLSEEASVYFPFQWPGIRAAITSKSFSDFIHSPYLSDSTAAQSQFSRLSDSETGKIIVNDIGKLETIDNDWEQITSKIGFHLNLPVRNRSQRTYQQWRKYYSLDDINFIAEQYKVDMEAFNYSI